jgi:hypothetical protein
VFILKSCMYGHVLSSFDSILFVIWVLCATTEGVRLAFMLQKLKEDLLEGCSPRTARVISLSVTEALRLVKVVLLSPAIKGRQLFSLILSAMEEQTVDRVSLFESHSSLTSL